MLSLPGGLPVLNIPLIPASANAFVTLRGNLEAVYAPK